MNDEPDEQARTSSDDAETVDPADKTQPAEGGRDEAEDGEGGPDEDAEAGA